MTVIAHMSAQPVAKKLTSHRALRFLAATYCSTQDNLNRAMPRTPKPKLCPLPVEIAAMLTHTSTPPNNLQTAYEAISYAAVNQGLRIPLTN
jgi:hypothetical protein